MKIETARSAPSKPRSKPKKIKASTRWYLYDSESEEEAPGGDSGSDNEGGDEGKDLPPIFFEDGGVLCKATGHGVD